MNCMTMLGRALSWKGAARVLMASLCVMSAQAAVPPPLESRRFATEEPAPTELSGGASSEAAKPLGVRAYAEQWIDVRIDVTGRVIFEVELDGIRRTVELVPYSVRGGGYRVDECQGGAFVRHEAPPITTYRGSLVEVPEVTVVASVVDGQVFATIHKDGVQTHGIDPLETRNDLGLMNPGPIKHAVYAAGEVVGPYGECGAGGLAIGLPVGGQAARPSGRAGGCLRQIDLAVDTDYEFYRDNGSSTVQATADAEAIVNQVDFIYARDVGIRVRIASLTLRTTEASDIYTEQAAGGLLGQLRAWWLANGTGVARDLTHLFSSTPADDGILGVAYVGVTPCTDIGYGMSRTRVGSSITTRAATVCHEIGHNMSSPHCDSDPACSIMCSGIGGCGGGFQFEDGSARIIIAAREAALGCLGLGEALEAEARPRAISDSVQAIQGVARRIDVLANDFDANCEGFVLFGFSSPTPAGTVTRSAGTGPSGRDELIYVAPASFTGAATFVYSVSSPIGERSTASVRVEVLARPGDPPGSQKLTQWDFEDQAQVLRATLGAGVMRFWDRAGDGVPGRTQSITPGGTTTTFALPNIAGRSSGVLRVPAYAPTQSLLVSHGAPGNGGGGYVNQYSIVFDLLIPASAYTRPWFSFFNTNDANRNDGDAFAVFPSGAIGISGGYSGMLRPDTWHRVVLVFDLAAPAGTPDLRKYIDGVELGAQDVGGIDGRFALYSTTDGVPTVDHFLLFGDDSGETAEAYLSSFAFVDRALAPAEVVLLAGPDADGPFSRSCASDLDDGSGTGTPDGGVDINDLLFFLAQFEAGTLAADLDDGSGTGTPDGGVDINDMLFFLARFEQGC